MSDPVRGYRFHPLERRGLLLGLGGGQLAVVGLGAAGAVVALRTGAGLVPAVLTLAVAAATVWLPVSGATLLQWLPVVVSWAVSHLFPLTGPAGRTAAPPGIGLLAAPEAPGESPLGVLHDRHLGSWAAVLAVTAPPFMLLDAEDKRRQLAAWGAVLDSTARPSSPVHRVQWVARTLPVDVSPLRSRLDEVTRERGRGGSGAAGEQARSDAGDYEELLESARAGAFHEVLVVVSVHARTAGRQLRAFGHGAPAVCALLRRELRLLAGQLRRAGIEAAVPLDLEGLAGAVRRSYCPGARGSTASGGRTAWPTAWGDGWSSARVDGRWQATFWVAEWPRREVGPDFLLPLLSTTVARVVSVTMSPVPARAAVREAETARTAELADEELRRRTGFLSSARNRRRAEGVANREAELADGHAEMRFSGYVGVSGSTPQEMEDAAAAVEAAGQQCGLELRRIYGRQVEALTWTMPLGRGLR